MASPSSTRHGPRRATARCSGLLVAIVAALASSACAQVLGIPSDPEVVSTAPPAQALLTPASDADADTSSGDPAIAGDRSATEDTPSPDNARSDEAIPNELARPAPVPGPDAPAAELDGGGTEAEGEGPANGGVPVTEPAPEDVCPSPPARVPVDVVFIVDNSRSMAAEVGEFETALPRFASALDDDGVDYRIILLARHRDAARNASDAASTSVCIAAPLGGLEACPSPAPALGPRFFQYSIRIGGTSSFSQALAAFGSPDPFGLSSRGWSDWLRPDAGSVLVEISDGDSALPSAEFVNALAAAAPEHFAADAVDPGFVFHSIVGMSQRLLTLDVYSPDEGIRDEVCSAGGSDPANAGQVYQELSRSTGGLRQSICPADAMILRLAVIERDVVARSVVPCP